jgi:arsenate reductase-like glutaredoxin family protein
MIKIPKERAIQLLNHRINELSNYGIDMKAWKSRTILDVEQIFGRGSTQVITAIHIDTLDFGDPEKLNKIKRNCKQTLQGFINHINDFDIINKEKVEISEQEFKTKYQDLLKDWNDLVPDYNKLIKDFNQLHKDHDQLITENSMLKDKLKHHPATIEEIKILFLGANPKDEVKLRIDEELREIETKLKLASLREAFNISSKWAITTDLLQQAMLDEKPNIVHFSGHGSTAGIAIEDKLGNAKLLETEGLASLFDLFADDIKCVILNSCYSESQAKEISKYIPYVIGMKDSIGDEAAKSFSIGFYSALGAGKDIEFAFKMGVTSIKLEGISGDDLPILIK